MKSMRKYIGKIKKYIFLQIFFSALGSGFLAIAPLIERWVFDNALQVSYNQVIWAMIQYFILQISSAGMEYFAMYFSFGGAVRFEKNLEREIFDSELWKDKAVVMVSHFTEEEFLKKFDKVYILKDGALNLKD